MLLKQLEVWPLYAQIDLFDPRATEGPLFKTGNEPVIAAPGWITVATRSDCQGPIPVEVWKGRLEVDDPALSGAIFDGVLDLAGPTALVGNFIMNEAESLDLGTGKHRVRVYVSPVGKQPERVYFVVD